jgi:LAO/AO transport system kinase
VNKADLDGANRTVMELQEMVRMREDSPRFDPGHHGASAVPDAANEGDDGGEDDWEPPVLEAVAKTGEGVEGFLDTLDSHHEWLERTGKLDQLARERYGEEIRALLREDVNRLVGRELRDRGGIESYVDSVLARETDPYAVADELLAPLAECFEERRRE